MWSGLALGVCQARGVDTRLPLPAGVTQDAALSRRRPPPGSGAAACTWTARAPVSSSELPSERPIRPAIGRLVLKLNRANMEPFVVALSTLLLCSFLASRWQLCLPVHLGLGSFLGAVLCLAHVVSRSVDSTIKMSVTQRPC